MSPTATDYTVSEKILLAANELDKKGKEQFTAEDLIVSAWTRWPKTFGLKGYAEQYPDANKVLTSIMGERGLARRGWLVKKGKKLYGMTREGRRMIAKLLNEEEEAPPGNYIEISRDKEKFLIGLFGSSAYQKFENNQKGELTFADACRFWDIGQNLQGEAVDERLDLVTRTFNELEQELAQEDGRLSNGRLVTAGDIRALRNIHANMADRFERLLNLLRSRK